jgi:uncharacterized membrane protein
LAGKGDQVTRLSNNKVGIAVAVVVGAFLATVGLIWVSYALAQGADIFGAPSAEWGTVAAWAGGIATFLAALVALMGAAGVFSSFRASRLRFTFEHTQPWCRTEPDGELWVRVAVENVGRRPAHGCVGRITALATDGHTRADLDPVQLRWAGVPPARASDPMDIRPGQREFLDVLRVRPGAPWRLVTFDDPDFDPGFSLNLAPGHEHVITLAVFSDNVGAPVSSLAAEMTPTGQITTLRTSPILVAGKGDQVVRLSGNKVRIAVAVVIGAFLATVGLIWVSYALARGAEIFGAPSAEWGTVAAWARGIATFLAALVALMGAAGVFSSFRASRLRFTFEHTQPWCRTEPDGELWVRVAVQNVGRRPAHDCVGRITALATDGHTRADLDPVQLRWAGVPPARASDPMDIRPGQREFLNVLRVRPGAPWRLVTFDDPDFDPGFPLNLAPGHEHVITLAVFSDNVGAPVSSLAAEMTPTGQITTLQTTPVLVARPRAARAPQNGPRSSDRARRSG